jgi:hypothetical protein
MFGITSFDKKFRVHPKKLVHHFLGYRSHNIVDLVDVPFSLRLLSQALGDNRRQV